MTTPSNQPPATVRAQISPTELEDLGVLRGLALLPVWGIISSCNIVDLEPGSILLRQGQPNNSLFVIIDGRLSVRLGAFDGSEIAQLSKGESVGELSIIDNRPASAWVVATVASRLLQIEEDTFWDLVATSHQFAVNLLLLLASRLRGNNANLGQSQELTARWERLATVDALTGQHNRRWFEETWPRLVSRFKYSGEPLSIVMVDIDHFKSFNDRFGHAVGDLVLTSVAKTLAQQVRPTDMVVRMGGEELLIVLPHTDLKGAILAAERVRTAVANAKSQTPDGATLPQVTISLGVSLLTRDDTPTTAVERADRALYQAKAEGRNRVVANNGA
jgi:diguanylate cyclase (GGDEF)-like protein